MSTLGREECSCCAQGCRLMGTAIHVLSAAQSVCHAVSGRVLKEASPEASAMLRYALRHVQYISAGRAGVISRGRRRTWTVGGGAAVAGHLGRLAVLPGCVAARYRRCEAQQV